MTTSASAFSPEQEEFLRDHKLAVFATTRKDGSPQLSQIMYDYDGNDIAISIKSYTAKWHNVLRQPRISLLVHDGRKQLIIYGRAEAIAEDPERIDLTVRVFRQLTGNAEIEATPDFVKAMDEQKRTVLRIVADKVMMNE